MSDIKEQGDFIIGVKASDDRQKFIRENFDFLDSKNEIFIPSPFLGIMSQRNSVGEEIPDKTQPKETAYRAQHWELRDWGGTLHSGTSEVPYQRFPRTFIEQKNCNLLILMILPMIMRN